MITLNILPPSRKQDLRLNQLYLMIKNLIILVLFLNIIVAIVLLFAKMTLQNYFIQIVDETTLTTQYAQIFNKDIKDLNKDLKAVEKIQEEYIYWTNFFVQFTSLVPDNIRINSLSLNQDKILVSGLARTRDDLLKLKDNLEKSDLYSEVVVPLDNLLKKENVDFDLKSTIDLDKLK